MSDGGEPTDIAESTASSEKRGFAGSTAIDEAASERARDKSTENERSPWTQGRGVWLVLGILFLSFFVIPWALVFLPAAQEAVRLVGFSFRDAYLVIPLLPAIGLGLVGVWTALRSQRN